VTLNAPSLESRAVKDAWQGTDLILLPELPCVSKVVILLDPPPAIVAGSFVGDGPGDGL